MKGHISKNKFTEIKDSVSVTANSNILEWIISDHTDNYKNDDYKNLMQSLTDEMKNEFGDPHDTLVGEYIIDVWELSYDNLEFNIFTGKGKGTSIEIVGKNYMDISNKMYQKSVLNFLKEFSKLING